MNTESFLDAFDDDDATVRTSCSELVTLLDRMDSDAEAHQPATMALAPTLNLLSLALRSDDDAITLMRVLYVNGDAEGARRLGAMLVPAPIGSAGEQGLRVNYGAKVAVQLPANEPITFQLKPGVLVISTSAGTHELASPRVGPTTRRQNEVSVATRQKYPSIESIRVNAL